MRWRAGAALSLMLAGALLTACTPEPTPTPSPTGFASEEEAFAAAEATYRAYVDAVNQVDLADPATFDMPLQWSAPPLRDVDRKSFSESHAEQRELSGAFLIASVSPVGWDISSGFAELAVCLDVSNTDVRDANGISIVPAGRAPVIALSVDLRPSVTTPTGLAVAETSARNGEPRC